MPDGGSNKVARMDDSDAGKSKGEASSKDNTAESAARRRSAGGLSTKACPACGHVNPLARLSCMLCAAKFSVKQTAELLQQRHTGDGSSGATRYAELETGLDPELEAPGSVDPSSADVSAQAFKLLPEEAQMQVMQEKAAHRLLAQTLHQQMLEELHKNPALAADPEQQLQFKRLAQQQLLYQMALAAQAAAPPQNGSADAAFEQMLGGMGALDQAAWVLDARDGDDEEPGGYGRHGDADADEEAAYERYGFGGFGRSSYDQLADFVESDDFGPSAARNYPTAYPFPDSSVYGYRGKAGKPRGFLDDDGLGYPDDFDPLGPGMRGRGAGDPFAQNAKGSKGKGAGSKRPVTGDNGGSWKRVRLILSGCDKGSGKGKGKGKNKEKVATAAAAAAAAAAVSAAAADASGNACSEAGSMGGSASGGAVAMGPAEPRAPPKRRAWLSEREAQEALSEVRFPPSAASARLLKQLADFNPSGSGDSARNALLPNEHDAKERGEAWRLPEGGCPADLLRAAEQQAGAEARCEHAVDRDGDAGAEQGKDVSSVDSLDGNGLSLAHREGKRLMPPPDGRLSMLSSKPMLPMPKGGGSWGSGGSSGSGPGGCDFEPAVLKTAGHEMRRDISMSAVDALVAMDMRGGSGNDSPRRQGGSRSMLGVGGKLTNPLSIPFNFSDSPASGSVDGASPKPLLPMLPDVDGGFKSTLSLGSSPLDSSPRNSLGPSIGMGDFSCLPTPRLPCSRRSSNDGLPASRRASADEEGAVDVASPTDGALPMEGESSFREGALSATGAMTGAGAGTRSGADTCENMSLRMGTPPESEDLGKQSAEDSEPLVVLDDEFRVSRDDTSDLPPVAAVPAAASVAAIDVEMADAAMADAAMADFAKTGEAASLEQLLE